MMVARKLKAVARRALRAWNPPPPKAPAAVPPSGTITFADLSEAPDPALLPWLDRPGIDPATLSPDQLSWWRDGVVIRRGFFSDAELDPYIARRERIDSDGPGLYVRGWHTPTPYLHVPELRALALHPPMMQLLRELLGEQMMLHLCLTGWNTTGRDWHQDDYLNPPFVNSWYAAVWIALDRIDPRSGPFQYVPGSHRWPLLRQTLVKSFLPPETRDAVSPIGAQLWPELSQHYVGAAVQAEIARRQAGLQSFLGEKGDLLIWHGRLMHRGSVAEQPDLPRRSLIAHYSGIEHRKDMPARAADANGEIFAVFDHPLR